MWEFREEEGGMGGWEIRRCLRKELEERKGEDVLIYFRRKKKKRDRELEM